MDAKFLQDVVNFLRSYQEALQEMHGKAKDSPEGYAALLESGAFFEFGEGLEAYFLQFWVLLPGHMRAQMEKKVSIQLCEPERYTIENVAGVCHYTIQKALSIPVSQQTLQTTNAALVLYETAFVLMEIMMRFESKLNSNAFLDRLKLDPDRDPAIELTRIARYLQNHVLIRAKGRPIRIAEVEAYLHSAKHPDPFVHRAAEQEKHCHWYVHKRGSAHKEGKWKGLDITFGAEGTHQGGFLIRGMSAIDEQGHYVDGPSRCVDELLKLLGKSTAGDLAKSLHGVITKESSPELYLESSPFLQFGEWCAAPRVGLSLANESLEERKYYLQRLYRFHICPDQTKNDSKLIFLSLVTQGWSGGHARMLMNMKEYQCRKAIEAFLAGRGKAPQEFIDRKKLGEYDRCELKGALASPAIHEIVANVTLEADEAEHPHFSEFEDVA